MDLNFCKGLTYKSMSYRIIIEVGGTLDFIKDIVDKTLFIVPDSVKEKILLYMEENQLFFPFKLMTLEEVRNFCTFTYDENAICFLQKKYKVKREIALIYLENLYYIDDSSSANMCLLRQIKQELDEKHLLLSHPHFFDYLKTFSIILYGYDKITKYEEKLLKDIEFYVPIKRVESSSYPLERAYACQTGEEELTYVFEEISVLLERGIALSHIYITNVPEEMYPKIKRLAKAYHIPLQKEKAFLYGTPMYAKIKKEIMEGKQNINLPSFMEKLFDRLNEIIDIEEYDLEELMDTFAQEISIEEEITNDLKIGPLLNTIYLEEDYVFILNANASLLPVTHKDEDFLYDAIKPSFLENTCEKNLLYLESTKKAIEKIKNKVVIFIKEEEGVEYYPSVLLEDICISKIEYSGVSHYSHALNKKNLVVFLDDYHKYGVLASFLPQLKQSYPLAYQSYTSKFKGLGKEKLNTYLGGQLLLSYSSINTFYECSFKYYLEYILRLSPYEEKFTAFLGSLYHIILKEKPKDIGMYIRSYLAEKKRNLSKKEEFYIYLNISDIQEVNAFFEDFKNHSTFEEEQRETKICLPLESSLAVTIMGVIDKIWMNQDLNLAVLIDYKTGKADIQLKDIYYGLSMQLPLYYYLIKKSRPELKIIGFYLESILEKNFRYQSGKTEKEQKRDSLKLNGYTLASEEQLLKLDQTYKDSRFIKSIKMASNGFYAYSKLLSEEKMNNLVNFVEEKIREMVQAVEKAEFFINPKQLRRENISCKYCKYRSICFMEENDVVPLEELRDIQFLGGDRDA